ncbi:MAG: AMP-binding protein [Trichodesmium sp. MO_231.B1]|nr:AMP-binding protein [Trichodesmium sp. MO_231.B1]
MSINTELDFEIAENQYELSQSSFFWTDPKLFDDRQQQNINTLIAIQQVLMRHPTFDGSEEDISEIQEFLEVYHQIATEASEKFSLIWSDPFANHWCLLAFDLVTAAITKKPLPLVTQEYCQAIQQKTPLQALIFHLNQFKLFALAYGFLSQQSYQFKTPLICHLPAAIPGTSLYLKGNGKIEIYGINSEKSELLVTHNKQTLELTPNATLADENLKVGKSPTIQLPSRELRFQPYCFNSPAFPDGQTVVETGMTYQGQYVTLVKDGLALIEEYHPQTFEQLHYFMQVLALKPIDVGTFTNLTSSDFSGALICSVIENPYRLADNFIHEFHHNRLFLIEQNNPLLLDSVEDAQANNLYYSPWRLDLRPLRGIFHAIYVYTPVAQFWLNVYRANPTGELLDLTKSQLIKIPLQLQIGLEQLRKYAKFTPLGQDLFNELERQLAQINQEIAQLQIPKDVPDLDFQQNGSFLYNLRPGTAQFLTVKEATLNHIKRFDYFKQIDTKLQASLGLDSLSKNGIEEKLAAIAYGERLTGAFEFVSSLAETLKQKIDRFSESEIIDLREEQGVSRTYGELWQQSTTLLGYLQEQGLSPGDFVIIHVEHCDDFVAAVWSCFLGGFVAVPATISPNSSNTTAQNAKLQQVWQGLDNPVILTAQNLTETINNILKDSTPNLLTLEKSQEFAPSQNFHDNQPEDLALLLASSGTTGTPKLISFDAVTVISQFLSGNEKSESSYCSLSWVPFDNASGFGIVNPKSGKTLYLPAERFFGNPLLWLDIVEQYKVNGTVLTNFAMTQIMEQIQEVSEPRWDLSSIETIGLGAEKIVPQTCRSFLQTLQPLGLGSDVLNVGYGLSETGVVASNREWIAMGYNQRGEQFVQIGKPLPGCGIRIVDDENNLLNEGEVGRIQIWGVNRTGVYYNNPTLNRTLFTEDDWLNTGDLGFLNQNYLTVTGREKEIVIINGKNYSCQEIELIVEEVEGVQPFYTVACNIRQQNSNTDELAIFFHTAITEDSQLVKLIKQIRGKVTKTLGINPNYIIPLDKYAIPRTLTGKIQRLQLKQNLENGGFDVILKRVDKIIQQEFEQTFVAPRDEIELQLSKIWEKVLGIQPISIKDNFFNLGGHSLLATRLFSQIEEELNNKIPVATLLEAPTIEKLAKVIREKGYSARWRSLVPIQPLGSKTPIFCMHALGASVLYYRRLALELGLDQPFYGLQAQGLDGKQPPLTKIEDMAARYVKEIQTIQPEGDYIIGGSSFGGMVALEVAQQLIAQGQRVALLVVFDTPAPGCFTRIPLNQRLSDHFDNFWKLGPNYILKKITGRFQWFKHRNKERNQRNSFSLDNINPNQIVQRANKQAGRKYVPQVYPGKVALFRAIHKSAPEGWQVDPQMGWGNLASGELEVYEVPGGHSTIFREPHVQVLAEKLRVAVNNLDSNGMTTIFR